MSPASAIESQSEESGESLSSSSSLSSFSLLSSLSTSLTFLREPELGRKARGSSGEASEVNGIHRGSHLEVGGLGPAQLQQKRARVEERAFQCAELAQHSSSLPTLAERSFASPLSGPLALAACHVLEQTGASSGINDQPAAGGNLNSASEWRPR